MCFVKKILFQSLLLLLLERCRSMLLKPFRIKVEPTLVIYDYFINNKFYNSQIKKILLKENKE